MKSLLLALIVAVAAASAEDEGVLVGTIKSKAHGVKGQVFAVDEKTLLVKNFEYDGQGPDAFFWVGTTARPGDEGHILPYPFDGKFYGYKDDSAPVLTGAFDGTKDIRLTLPDDLNVSDLKWFSVWCRQFSANFGDLFFPDNFAIDKTTVPTTTSTTPADLPPPLVHPSNTLDDDAASDDSDVAAEPESEPDQHEDHRSRHGGAAGVAASSIAMAVSYVVAKFLL
jgi:hypothetical protein